MEQNGSLAAVSGDTPISLLNLAGSHDSATAYPSYAHWAQCQDLNIREQLSIGVRLLDIRLYERGGQFRLVHSVADCYQNSEKTALLCFDSILEDCISFLEENPEEMIVMSVKLDRGNRETQFFKKFYDTYIKEKDIPWFLENRIPRLSEVRGKIVLMRRFIRPYGYLGSDAADRLGLDFSVWENQNAPTPAPPFTVGIARGVTASVQDNYNLGPHEKWEAAVLPFLETQKPTETKITLNCVSTSGGGKTPRESATYVNPKFLEQPFPSHQKQGWFLLDFITEDLVLKIMQGNG